MADDDEVDDVRWVALDEVPEWLTCDRDAAVLRELGGMDLVR